VQASAIPAAPRGIDGRGRWLLPLAAALFIVLLLVLIMRWMITIPEAPPQAEDTAQAVQMVKLEKPDSTPPAALPEATPPPPPAAPPSLNRADLPPIPTPTISMTPTPVQIAVGGGASLGQGLSLGSSGVFGGFARGGGGGGGGGGNGQGQGFSGKELIPISTSRPQMPAWACKQKIKGWVELVFTVMPNGRVHDVKIVDAQPRGVFEDNAVQRVSNWIYEEAKQPREVDQRVDYDPAECDLNWDG
jgi:periplasmic protein TonB